MKSIEDFTQDVLQKKQRLKKKKRIIRSSVALSLVGLLTFGILYSNIIPFGTLFQSRAYERYMQSYVSSDQTTRLKIIDGDNAVITVDNRAYACALEEVNAQTFSLSLQSREKQNQSLSVRFSDGKAELSGELNGENIGETLNAAQDIKVESGKWIEFETKQQYEEDAISSLFDWLLVNEKQSFCGTKWSTLECQFVAVGDVVLQYVKDQVSGLCAALLFENVATDVYGFPVVSVTEYDPSDDSGWTTSYFKQIDEESKIEFSGGKFEANLVDYELISRVLDDSEMGDIERVQGGIGWRFVPVSPISKTRLTNLKLSLDLKKDGSLSFRSSGQWLLNTSCGGTWTAFEDFVLVVLDKEYPQLGLKAFTIKKDKKTLLRGDFLQTAVSEIDAVGVYKVGYHTFTYYQCVANATVYWGSEWSEEVFTPKLLYDTVYAFDGWLEDWHTADGEGEHIPLVETEGMELIFRENKKLEVYKNGELVDKMSFWLEFDHSLNDFGSLKFYQYKKLDIKCENKTESTGRLHIGAKYVMTTSRESRVLDGVEYTRTWYFCFSAS